MSHAIDPVEQARTALRSGDLRTAEQLLLRLHEGGPASAQSLALLGDVRRRQSRFEAAVESYQAALVLRPRAPAILQDLSGCLLRLGRPADALQVLAGLDVLAPAGLHYNQGLAFESLGRLDQAVTAYRHALSVDADHLGALNNLGNALCELRKPDEAESTLLRAIRIHPELWTAHTNLGNALRLQGRVEEACSSYRQATLLERASPVAWSNLLASMTYLPGRSKSDDEVLYREFDALLSSVAPLPRPKRARERSGKLRIGYLSADLKNHVSNYFFEPVLAAHDRREFDVFCYDSTATQDEVSARLQQTQTTWRAICRLSDDQAAHLIAADDLDLLVDLMGHTAGNRLAVFARRPAPVQLTWLAFPASTGLTAMDYWITDGCIAAEDCPHDYRTERFIKLPHFEMCFRPDADAPAVAEPPCLRNGFITFGSFNARYKLNDQVLDCWAQILRALPTSRLMLVSIPEGTAGDSLIQALESREVHRDRVYLESRVSLRRFLELHGQVDLALDAFPYNGTTTTLQGLWMGVPIVALAGKRYCGRVGLSILRNLGLEELIADSPEEYARLATDLAQDSRRLQVLRASMRERMRRSPICDERGFTADLEAAYRSIAHRATTSSSRISAKVGEEQTMRVAVVTPYFREERSILERSIASVASQRYRCDHIVVADGRPQEWIDERADVLHLRLPRNTADYGDTPRAIGAAYACGRDYDAITFLDADNEFADDEAIERYVRIAEEQQWDLVVGRRIFVRPDGSVLPIEDEPMDALIDVSCYFFLRSGFDVAIKWCLIPPSLHCVDDRVIRLAAEVAGLKTAVVDVPTIRYYTRFLAHYRMAGETPPPDAKDFDATLDRMMDEWEQVPEDRKARYFDALGFRVNVGRTK